VQKKLTARAHDFRQVVGLAATVHVHLSMIGLGLVFAITCQFV
jgi:hypothetical protein